MTSIHPSTKFFNLTGKTALVTGAASGIGAAIARRFASAGARVVVVDRDGSGAEAVALEIGGQAMVLDVTDEDACIRAATEHEMVDILVNNAGVGAVGTIIQTSGADLDRLYTVNVRGIFNMTKAFLPGMIARQSGNLINLASVGGVTGIPDRFAYCASKFAVVGMTKCLALDHATDGIRANCLCPGRVETPFVQARLAEYPDPVQARREMSATQLFGRMIAPEEVAAAAHYLASDESYMVTGTAFLVECGWTAGK